MTILNFRKVLGMFHASLDKLRYQFGTDEGFKGYRTELTVQEGHLNLSKEFRISSELQFTWNWLSRFGA